MYSFLLSGDDIPECGTCQCPLTVKHSLVQCVDLNDVYEINTSLVKHSLVQCVDLNDVYEINTSLLLLLKMYLIISKHGKTLILLKKLVFIGNFNVFILMFVICFFILA